MSVRCRLIAAWLLSLAALAAFQSARADEIRVIASNAVKEAFIELIDYLTSPAAKHAIQHSGLEPR